MRRFLQARETEMAECVCPKCGVVYWKKLDVSYIIRVDIEKRGGCIVVMCKECGTIENSTDNDK